MKRLNERRKAETREEVETEWEKVKAVHTKTGEASFKEFGQVDEDMYFILMDKRPVTPTKRLRAQSLVKDSTLTSSCTCGTRARQA